MKTMLEAAKAAKFSVTALTTDQKNAALEAMAQALLDNQEAILAANAMDIENATGKVPQVMLDRLLLTADRIAGMAKGIREVAALPDPVGHLLERHTRADGLQIDKISVPMGVIAIIYESRPNVTSDAAALALKAGSVCILRGGKEAFASANAIVTALKKGLQSVGVTEDAVNLVQDTSRASATALMTANGYVDLLILLSDIDGLYTADPHRDPEAKRLTHVPALTEEIYALAGVSASTQGTGGMVTKLQAAKICLDAGCAMVIANGNTPENLYDILDGKPVGTLFGEVTL